MDKQTVKLILVCGIVGAFLVGALLLPGRGPETAEAQVANGSTLDEAIVTETCDLFWQEGQLFAYCESIAGEMRPFVNGESGE